MLLKDGAHRPSLHEQPVGLPLEFRREVDPSGDDTGDIRAATQLSEFFCVEFFPGHSDHPFGPDRFEHYYTGNGPTRKCPRQGVSRKSCAERVCPAFGVSLKPACRTRNVHSLGFGFFLTSRIWIACPFCGDGGSGLAKACVHLLGYSLMY